jgi:integrase
MRRFPLGRWPEMGLSEARDKARSLRAKVKDEGADPIAERRRIRAAGQDAAVGIGTLSAVLAAYGTGRGQELKTWPEAKRRIEHVFHAHLSRPLATLSAADLQLTADAHPAKQSAAAAVRYLRPVLRWGVIRGYGTKQLTDISPPATVKVRNRILDRSELVAILSIIKADGRAYHRAMWFMLLTLARRSEVCNARWRDIDFISAEWRISETKNGRPHRIPLSRQALEHLQNIEMRPSDKLIFATKSGGVLENWDKATKVIHRDSGTIGWTRHDLRRTGATLLGDLGVEPHVIEAALNHAVLHSQLAAVYNQARYVPQVRHALQLLADRLDGIAADGADVITLRAAS